MPWWEQLVLGLPWPVTVVLSVGIISCTAWRCCRIQSHADLERAKLQYGQDRGSGSQTREPRDTDTSNPVNRSRSNTNDSVARRCDPCQLLFALIESHELYHSHKEQMAWLGTALWVSGAAYLLGAKAPLWKNDLPAGLVYALIVTAAAAGFAFVWFQFRGRERGAAWSNACITVAARWATTGPTERELEPMPFKKERIEFPRAVTEEATRQLDGWRGFNGPRRSEYLAYLVMAAFAIMVIVRATTV